MHITAIGVRSIRVDRYTTEKSDFNRDNYMTTLNVDTDNGPVTIILASPEPVEIQDLNKSNEQ